MAHELLPLRRAKVTRLVKNKVKQSQARTASHFYTLYVGFNGC